MSYEGELIKSAFINGSDVMVVIKQGLKDPREYIDTMKGTEVLNPQRSVHGYKGFWLSENSHINACA